MHDMSNQRLKRGAPLPYKLLAGVEPCPDGWLVVTGKLQGVTLFPEPAQVLGKCPPRPAPFSALTCSRRA